MANSTTTQILLDGARNCVIKFEGVLDTSDLASMVVVDPAVMAGLDNTGGLKAAKFRIFKLAYNVEDGLSLNLFWDGGTPARIEELTGREDQSFESFGGVVNNATLPNGKITATTEGWSGIKSFSLILELVKTQ